MLPDLSQSLDGHLANGDFNPVTQGGTSQRQIEQMGQSLTTITIGSSLNCAASLMAMRSRGMALNLPHLMTLENMDSLIRHLHQVSGREVPAWIERQRGQLLDAMIDCHTWLQSQRIALAAEADLLVAWCDFAQSQGMRVGPVIAPVNQQSLAGLPVEQVVIGDLEDLQTRLDSYPVSLLVANSHAAPLAEKTVSRWYVPVSRFTTVSGISPRAAGLCGYSRHLVRTREPNAGAPSHAGGVSLTAQASVQPEPGTGGQS